VTFREPDEQEEDKTETEPMMSDAIVRVYTYASQCLLSILTHSSLYIQSIPQGRGCIKNGALDLKLNI